VLWQVASRAAIHHPDHIASLKMNSLCRPTGRVVPAQNGMKKRFPFIFPGDQEKIACW